MVAAETKGKGDPCTVAETDCHQLIDMLRKAVLLIVE